VQGNAWFTFEGLERNIPFLSKEYTATALVGNLHVIFLLGPLLLAGLYRFNEHPRFLRVAASIAPLFILVHYAVGTIVEARLWMPLFVVLIPLALRNIDALVFVKDTEIPRGEVDSA
jgi:hypothetical protein